MISSSCGWKSKDLAVAQSHKASRWRREWIFPLPMSLCRFLADDVVQIKGVGYHTFNPRWPWSPCLNLLEFIATMLQDLHAQIQVRNLYLSASRLGSQVSLPILDCSLFQIKSSWQPGIVTIGAIRTCTVVTWGRFLLSTPTAFWAPAEMVRGQSRAHPS